MQMVIKLAIIPILRQLLVMTNIKKLLLGKGSAAAYAIITAIFTFVPEDFFKRGFFPCDWSESTILLVNRLIVFLILFILTNIVYCIYRSHRKSVSISDQSFEIIIEYGDLIAINDGLKVINFDECFTTTVGDRPIDINPNSVCGQYLAKYPIDDMQSLIQSVGLQPVGIAQCNNMPKFVSGMIIPKEDFFLMAFAKLNKDGLGEMTYTQYLDCLNRLWQQIDLYHGTDDVYLPILGSRITRFEKELSQQELLDIMIASYRLSPKKLKKPCSLHIVCKERENFSLNNIWGVD